MNNCTNTEENTADTVFKKGNASEEATARPLKTNVENHSSCYQSAPEVRRVGTLTMGFSLIATGIIALICTYYPRFDMTLVLKCTPVIFIFLGIEILTSYFFHKNVKLRYDFLSGFVCFLLICAGLTLTSVPTLLSYFGPEAQLARDTVNTQIKEDVYRELEQNKSIHTLYVRSYIPDSISYHNEADLDKMKNYADVYINVELAGPFTNENAFSDSSKALLEDLTTLPYRIREVQINATENSVRYHLGISEPIQYQLETERLSQFIDCETIELNPRSDESEG